MAMNIEQRLEQSAKSIEQSSQKAHDFAEKDITLQTCAGSRDSLPKVSRIWQENFARQFNKHATEFQDRFALSQQSLPWQAGITISDSLQRYHVGVQGEEGYKEFLPNPLKLPFETAATLADDLTQDRWLENGVPNKHWTESKVASALEKSLGVNARIWPKDRDLQVGDVIPSAQETADGLPITHVIVDGNAYAMSPVASGLVSDLTSTGATIGGVLVAFTSVSDSSQIKLKRSPVAYAIKSVSDFYSSTTYSISEFVDYITDKPVPNDPSTWDWSPAAQAASDLIRAAFISGLGGVLNYVEFSAGKYTFKSQVVWSQFVKVKAKGNVIVETHVVGDSAWRFTGKDGDPDPGVSLGDFNKQQWMNSPIIQGDNGSFFFVHKGASKPSGTVPVEIGVRQAESYNGSFNRYSANDFSATGYFAGMRLNAKNMYIANFRNLHLELNDNCVIFGEDDGVSINSGENITFTNCTLAGAESAFWIKVLNWGINLVNCSCDFLGTVFRDRGASSITVIGGHIEQVGAKSALTHDGQGGIYVAAFETGTAFSRRGKLTISGTKMVIKPELQIRSAYTLDCSVDGFISVIKTGNIQVPFGEFSHRDDPVYYKKFNITGFRTALIYPSRNRNYIQDQFFASVADGAFVANDQWGLFQANTKVIVSANTDYFGGKKISLSRTTGAVGAQFCDIAYMRNVDVSPGDVVKAMCAIRSPAGYTSYRTYVVYQWHDTDDTMIAQTVATLDRGAYAGDVYNFPHFIQSDFYPIAPLGAKYVKIRFGISEILEEGRVIDIIAPVIWKDS
ncbi:hypothetical protein NM917_001578 [Vibrio cholerae]|nr:hypothetical protein [Vibrio cholerae]